MATSKLKIGLCVIVVAGAAVLIFFQSQTQQKLRAESDSLHQQMAQLKSDPQETPAANSNSISSDDFNELLRLRGEVSALRSQTNQIARLQQQNQQLQDSLATVAQERQQSATNAAAERAYGLLQLNSVKTAMTGLLKYAADHNDTLPTNLYTPQARSYFSSDSYATNLNSVRFAYQGPLSSISNPASAIVVESVQIFMQNGNWTRAYGFADGHAEFHSAPNLEQWEERHVPVLKNQ